MHTISTVTTLCTLLAMASGVLSASASLKGCFSSTSSLNLAGSQTFNSMGSCSSLCLSKKAGAMAMQDSECYCGSTLPPADTLIDDSKCSIPCPGYPSDQCGGVGAYSVYLTGLSLAVPNADSSSSPSLSSTPKSSSTSSSVPSVVTIGGETVVVTAKPQPSSDGASSDKNSNSSPNKSGIAAGVVVGLLAFGAIAGGIVLYLRNQKRRAIEEEHRQVAAVNSFIDGGKYPGPVTDTRLDPAVMASRRMSDGSIADNQDYSRRILKVTNA
ncbi:putative wsc domain containing protein [Golovinomyces cichoracearum]|uniref:Putative wsc domain containing protein n=1 Tax=Golovinomyces cichoracearum TaxID=62708 RepID=A0A420IJK7_9PEZI|nr:putative wsc domain containing protein [Golovinomyces cichoracearum]